MIIRPDDNVPNRSTARFIVRPDLSTAHPADPLMSIILQLIHPSIRASDDPSSFSVGRPSPTFRPNNFPTDDLIILSLIHPIIRAFDDLLVLSVGRPSPTCRPIVRPSDDPTSLSFIRPIIHPNDEPFILSELAFRPIIHPIDNPFIQLVGRPSPIQSHPSVHPTIFHENHPNRPPDLTPNSLESSEEGFSTAMSEWPVLHQMENVTFLFQHFPGLAFKPPAGLGSNIMKDPPPNRSFHTWPGD